MNKKKLPLSLGLVILLISSATTSMSLRVNAGEGNAPGASIDSGSSVGGSFSPANQVSPPAASPGTNVNVSNEGNITAPAAVQANVNQAAQSLASNPSPAVQAVINIASGGNSAGNSVQISLSATGVSPAAISGLLNAVAGLFGGASFSSDSSNIPVAELQDTQLAAGTQRTRLSNNQEASSLLVAQNGQTPKVDVNQLNAAIEAYNKVINESDAETLKKLAKNEEFLAIGKVLRDLRAALQG